jgi:general L-amino acid transport system permease protein
MRQPSSRRPRARTLVWQAAAVAFVLVFLALAAAQTTANLRQRGITSGFDYLGRAAGFEIAPGPLPYSSRDTYLRALAVGVVNTLRVCVPAIGLAAVLGLIVGLASFSHIGGVSALSRAYVEVLRNTPLLLQLFFWYALSQALPGPHEALNPAPGVFLCERGLHVTGIAWRAGGLTLERPALIGFDFRGGLSITPEFAVLLIGLSTNTAAFLGEIVRGGVLAVDHGQSEAAAALGLSRGRTLRLVVLPQALRAIIPPATSQFLNLAKNSSLAVAIGYPDVISITSTTLNQTGQAIEAITLATIVYLAIGLTVSLILNGHHVAAGASGERAR